MTVPNWKEHLAVIFYCTCCDDDDDDDRIAATEGNGVKLGNFIGKNGKIVNPRKTVEMKYMN